MMGNLSRRRFGASVVAVALAGPARAQGLSRRPVTVVVPYSAGSPPDIVARLVAEELQRRWGQPFVADNRPGASGNIGTAMVARAAPDGHTLVVTAGTMAMNVSLFRNLPYDPVTSFAPIALLAQVPFAIIAHPSAGASLQEFLENARRHPGRLNYGSPGVGTPHHLAMEMFKQRTAIQVEHVPYRAVAGAVADLLAGNIGVMFIPITTAVELARDGRVRILAVATEARLPQAPDVPTVAEAGVPGVVMRDWYGLFAPAGTPPEILRRLNESVNEVLTTAEVAQALTAQGMTAIGGPPERLRDRLAADLLFWAAVIREAGITVD
ncbi:MAG: tripartite tricarboxylate transporter substrate binding protein [Rhodovarius sp.]|nr:tripartite tricarboxylate transporter substrate binding protein [Rhodovarius sp.]